jgi:hypothetical protein
LLTNATVVDDAIRFVSKMSNEKLNPLSNNDEDSKESKEPDHNQDKDQLEEEEKQEEESIETTTNQVF